MAHHAAACARLYFAETATTCSVRDTLCLLTSKWSARWICQLSKPCTPAHWPGYAELQTDTGKRARLLGNAALLEADVAGAEGQLRHQEALVVELQHLRHTLSLVRG